MTIEQLRKPRKAIFIALIVSLLTIFFINKGYQNDPSYLSGDEPHYIMMTDSLVKDHDFNLKNDYELGRSTSYYQGPSLYPHISPQSDINSDNWYSIHTIGLPILMYMPYKIYGVIGTRLFVILLQVSTLLIFYLILKKYLKNKANVVVGTIISGSCALFWQSLGSIMPDMILVNLFGLSILLFDDEREYTELILAGIFLLSGLVHTKGMLLVGPIISFRWLWQIKKLGFKNWLKKDYKAFLILIAGYGLYMHFLHSHYGIFSPTQLYGNNGQLFTANPIDNLTAILTDRSKGILVYFPVICIAGPYLLRSLFSIRGRIKSLSTNYKSKIGKTDYLIVALLIGVGTFFITQVGFLDWSGSTAPNGRYMLPIVFFLIFLVAKYSDTKNHIEMLILGSVTGLSLLLTIFSILNFKYYMSTGVDSFWVQRFHPLTNLPLFQTYSNTSQQSLHRGLKIFLLLIILNIVLTAIYRLRYRIKLEKVAYPRRNETNII